MKYEVREVTAEELLIRHPSRIIVGGPSMSGKSQLVKRLLVSVEETFTGFETYPIRAIWVYGIFCPDYATDVVTPYIHLSFQTELPTAEDRFDILILDDVMSTLIDDARLANIFTKDSHHRNFSVFFLVQNIFATGKFMRTASLNANYFILMKTRRDLTQIKRLGSQFFPGSTDYFMDAYKAAVSLHPFSYLLIDAHRDTDEFLSLRSGITPEEYPISVFENAKSKNTQK